MKFKVEAKCPGCNLTTDVIVRKPTLMKPITRYADCENCSSELLIKVSLDRRVIPRNGQFPLLVSTALHTESDTARALKAEEKEYRDGARVLGSPQ